MPLLGKAIGSAFNYLDFGMETTKQVEQFDGIVGDSAPMRVLAAMVLKVAPCDFPVLIRGGSGTGKELIAKSIQKNSKRANGPFLSINCGAIPESLIEAHLFGHQKGAFTGASSDKPGLFETAHVGTIFLDELGEMPLAMQVKRLRALQEKEIVRVGATKPIRVDVRLIAATHRDLKVMAGAGQFRQDLYYRIATLEIEVPALRQGPEDIVSLAGHFLEKAQRHGDFDRTVAIGSNAIDVLTDYDWPGNVRELENVINRLIVLSGHPVITGLDVLRALGTDQSVAQPDEPARLLPVKTRLILPSSIAEFRADDTMATYLKRAKFTVLEAAMAEYENRQAAADRVGMAEDTVRKLLGYTYIYDHLDEDLDLNTLAEVACLSPYHWHRIYQAIREETIAATVKRLRLHRAAGYLANTSLTIRQIAEMSGYRNVQSFTRIFSSIYGMPPAQYRRNGSHTRFQTRSKGWSNVMYEVSIKTVPEMKAITLEHIGSYMQIGKAFDLLGVLLASRNLIEPGMRAVAIYYDDPSVVAEEKLRSRGCGYW